MGIQVPMKYHYIMKKNLTLFYKIYNTIYVTNFI